METPTYNTIDMSGISPINWVPDPENRNWIYNASYESKIVPLPDGALYIKVLTDNPAPMFLLTDTTPPAQGSTTPHLSSGDSALRLIEGTTSVKIPTDCHAIGILIKRQNYYNQSISYCTESLLSVVNAAIDSKISQSQPNNSQVSATSRTTGYKFNDDGTHSTNANYEVIRFKLTDIDKDARKINIICNFAQSEGNRMIYFATGSGMGTVLATPVIEGTYHDDIWDIPATANYLLMSKRLSDPDPIVSAVGQNISNLYKKSERIPNAEYMQFSRLSCGNGMCLGYSGRYVFTNGADGVVKIDFGIESAPEIVGAQIAGHGSDFRPCSCAVLDDYLYLATRNKGSGEAQSGSSEYGGFLDIIKISTWEVVNTISYPVNSSANAYYGKATGVAAYGNYLAVALNMEGWKLYDITNRTSPTLLATVDVRHQGYEYQSAEFYKDANENLRLVMTGYGENMIEIYDPTSSITSRSSALYTLYYEDLSLNIKSHTRMSTVKYPYVYSTIGPWPGSTYQESPLRQIGILVTDISDISNPTTSLIEVAPEDRGNAFATEGSPYDIAMLDDNVIVNNYTKGFSVFGIANPASPVYKYTFGYEKAGDVVATADGRLICRTNSKGSETYDNKVSTWRQMFSFD